MTMTERLPAKIAVIPTSHLDLFWLGDYRACLRRGDEVIRSYLDRLLETEDETFVIDTVIFAEHFLDGHPDYVDPMRRLVAEGRLEIGAAYIDRWENLVLGESIIRNIQIGRRWARDRLGIDAVMAAHPDLPGLNAQTSQIYAQAGIRYYVTSRKIFHEGRVWQHRAPDGTSLTMLSWPVHYVFVPFLPGTLDATAKGTFTGDRSLSLEGVNERYPAGTMAVSGSAGDLTSPEDFPSRYGRSLAEYLARYRTLLTDVEIFYATPHEVMRPYLSSDIDVPETAGSIPSVWGVAADEEMRFFHRTRGVERLLLDAETAAVLGLLRGRTSLPPEASAWRGLYAEDAFFESDDTPPLGKEWEWLWRMHVFTQDHNGGGQDGVLSSFQKKVRQDRLDDYANQVVEHAFFVPSGDGSPTVFRARLGLSERSLILDSETSRALGPWFERQPDALWQPVQQVDGEPAVALRLPACDGVGCEPLELDARPGKQARIRDDPTGVRVEADSVFVGADRASGRLEISDRRTGQRWSGVLGTLYAVRECGDDVTLRTDEDRTVEAATCSVEIVSHGPLATQLRLAQRILDATWVTLVTVWSTERRVDLDLRALWPGHRNWQVRMPIAEDIDRKSVHLGTAFHGMRWDDVPEHATPFSRDEISSVDYANYREAQHWLHLEGDRGGLTVATPHPAFHHDGFRLSAVLLRTPPSCGDRRMFWANSGEISYRFEFHLTDRNWQAARAPERGDRSWRRPTILPEGRGDSVDALRNLGDQVQLTACYPDSEGHIIVRMVNESDELAHVILAGEAVGDVAELIDLEDMTYETVDASDGRIELSLPPWRIQTARLRRPRREV